VAQRENNLDVSLELSNVKTTISVNESIGYLGEASSTATKTSSVLLDVPQSITVVTRKLLNDQGAVKLDDALQNVAGVMPGGYYDGWDYYRIRGFDASFNTYLDGMRGGNGISTKPGAWNR
jgi:iron complex outermembrane receptor protein